MSHPYYPLDIELDGYVPPVISYQRLLASFFGGCFVVMSLIWVFTGRVRLQPSERVLCAWFICTGIIHLVIEGHVVLNDKFYTSNTGNLLSEIWKEYSQADSRYATRDPFVICMEAVTAFMEGPGCFLIAYGIIRQRAWRYTAILLVSLGQIYGDVLYFGTCWLTGVHHYSRPEPMYFWFYFIIVNGIWIVVPGACLIYAARHIADAVNRAGKAKLQ